MGLSTVEATRSKEGERGHRGGCRRTGRRFFQISNSFNATREREGKKRNSERGRKQVSGERWVFSRPEPRRVNIVSLVCDALRESVAFVTVTTGWGREGTTWGSSLAPRTNRVSALVINWKRTVDPATKTRAWFLAGRVPRGGRTRQPPVAIGRVTQFS